MSISKRFKKFLRIAKNQALQSQHKQKHGSILIKGGTVINSSCNKNKFCRFAERFRSLPGNATIHAEIGSILYIPKEITNNATILVVRVDHKGNFSYSKPCEMCLEVLKFVGIKKVFYSVDSENIHCIHIGV